MIRRFAGAILLAATCLAGPAGADENWRDLQVEGGCLMRERLESYQPPGTVIEWDGACGADGYIAGSGLLRMTAPSEAENGSYALTLRGTFVSGVPDGEAVVEITYPETGAVEQQSYRFTRGCIEDDENCAPLAD